MKIIKIVNDNKYPEIYKVFLKTDRSFLAHTFVQIITSYIESLSFGEITIKKNTSTIKNEQLSHIIRLLKLNQKKIDIKKTSISFDSKKIVNIDYRAIWSKDFWDSKDQIPYIPNIYIMTLRKDEELVFNAKLLSSYSKIDNAYASVGNVGHRFLTYDETIKNKVKTEIPNLLITINLLEVYGIHELISKTVDKIIESLDIFKKLISNTKPEKFYRYVFKITEKTSCVPHLLGALQQELYILDEKNEYFISYDQNHPQIEEYEFYYNGPKKNMTECIDKIKKYISKLN
jgi:hypothetical protein